MALLMVSCDELPLNFGGNEVVASVDDKRLYAKDLRGVTTEGMSVEDSLAQVASFTDRWIRRAVKLREAERLFTSSEQDIDKLVEEYRQSLLIRKFDQYVIDQRDDMSETESQIVEYYNTHGEQFKLEKAIVKGYLIKIPRSYKGAQTLTKKMRSWRERDSLDVVSIIEKNDFERVQFESEWVDYGLFLDRLPVTRGSENLGVYLSRKGVQELKDSEFHYLFEFTNVLSKGDCAPLEQAKSAIAKILRRERQAAILNEVDTQLYNAAVREDIISNDVADHIAELERKKQEAQKEAQEVEQIEESLKEE